MKGSAMAVNAMADTPRRSVSLLAVQIVWVIVLVIALPIYVLGAPYRYAQLLALRQSPEAEMFFAQVGLSASTYVAFQVAIAFATGWACVAIALFIARRKSSDVMAMVISLLFIAFPINEFHLISGLSATSAIWNWIDHALRALSWAVIYTIFFIFPDGHFRARWMKWLVFAFFGVSLVWLLFPETPMNPVWEVTYRQAWPWSMFFLFGWYFIGVCAMVSRYRGAQVAAHKQQIKWAVFGLVIAFVIQVVTGFARILQQQLTHSANDPLIYIRYESIVVPLLDVSLLVVPICFMIAILKYRLWDIDVVINRSLVYSILSVAVFGLYASIVFGLNALFGTSVGASGNFAVSVVAAGVTAISFQPLHLRIRRAVNRLMYGRRDEAYAVIASLGKRLAGTLATGSVLSTIVETIGQELKLPYVGIATRHSEDYKVTAEFRAAPNGKNESSGGAPHNMAGLTSLPITYQSEVIARLSFAPRSPGEPLSKSDVGLLEDVARQAGPAVHDYLLAAELQRSREKLVIAREDERRRIRRQLHDGLMPALASQVLKLDEAHDLIHDDPGVAELTVENLKAHTRSLIGSGGRPSLRSR
jgi:hypothetical protein